MKATDTLVFFQILFDGRISGGSVGRPGPD